MAKLGGEALGGGLGTGDTGSEAEAAAAWRQAAARGGGRVEAARRERGRGQRWMGEAAAAVGGSPQEATYYAECARRLDAAASVRHGAAARAAVGVVGAKPARSPPHGH